MAESIKLSENFYKIKDAMDNFDQSRKKADMVFRGFVGNIFADFIYRSPVDKGFYRADWTMKQTTSSDALTAILLTNSMPYSGVMEVGSPVGKRPWPSAGPKTVNRNGRIWSSQMPSPVAGGAIDAADFDGLAETLTKVLTDQL